MMKQKRKKNNWFQLYDVDTSVTDALKTDLFISIKIRIGLQLKPTYFCNTV